MLYVVKKFPQRAFICISFKLVAVFRVVCVGVSLHRNSSCLALFSVRMSELTQGNLWLQFYKMNLCFVLFFLFKNWYKQVATWPSPTKVFVFYFTSGEIAVWFISGNEAEFLFRSNGLTEIKSCCDLWPQLLGLCVLVCVGFRVTRRLNLRSSKCTLTEKTKNKKWNREVSFVFVVS